MDQLKKLIGRHFVGQGTLLNFVLVLIGSFIGLIVQKNIDPAIVPIAQDALGIFTIGLGIKMFLGSKNLPWVAVALCLGGTLGYLLKLNDSFYILGSEIQRLIGGDQKFSEGFVSTFILFCIGPMTLLGCMEDAIQKKITLLSSKSVMDGFSSIFFAAAFGPALLVTAFCLLIFQGVITALAKPLQKSIGDETTISDISGTGGLILVAVGINMLEIKEINSIDYLPSLIFIAIFSKIASKVARNQVSLTRDAT